MICRSANDKWRTGSGTSAPWWIMWGILKRYPENSFYGIRLILHPNGANVDKEQRQVGHARNPLQSSVLLPLPMLDDPSYAYCIHYNPPWANFATGNPQNQRKGATRDPRTGQQGPECQTHLLSGRALSAMIYSNYLVCLSSQRGCQATYCLGCLLEIMSKIIWCHCF